MASPTINPHLQGRSTTELLTNAGAFPTSTFLIVLVNNVSSWPSYEIQSSNGFSGLLLCVHSNLSTSFKLSLLNFFSTSCHGHSGFHSSLNVEYHVFPVSRSHHSCLFTASPRSWSGVNTYIPVMHSHIDKASLSKFTSPFLGLAASEGSPKFTFPVPAGMCQQVLKFLWS